MSRAIILDSGPLSLLTHRRGVPAADACKQWLAARLAGGDHIFVPEIVDYDLRRELIRSGKTASVARLDAFNSAIAARYIPLTTPACRLAAQLWADIRRLGLPTSHPEELDIDVILAAQALSAGFVHADLIVATTNPAHISRFLAAEVWTNI